jgi:hypothetical protein
MMTAITPSTANTNSIIAASNTSQTLTVTVALGSSFIF